MEDLVAEARKGMQEREAIRAGVNIGGGGPIEPSNDQPSRPTPVPVERNNAGRTYGGGGSGRVPFKVTR